MKRNELVVQRANNQRLSSSGLQRPVDVVRWFGAMQAQDFAGAKWAIALRLRTATTDAAIEAAYNEGQILRTHLLRPTWHFVAPDDIRWLLQLTAPRINLRCGPNFRKLELDAPTFKRTNRILVKALQGGKHLTRSELKKALNRSGIIADDPLRTSHIMLRAELDGVVCSGPRVGKQFTYALLEERVAAAKTSLTRDEALAELTCRYFISHGPATLADFIWWSGLTAGDARRGLALIDSQLRKTLVNESDYHFLRSRSGAKGSATSAHLLPVYDEYNVAYKDREVTLEPSGSGLSKWDMLGPTVGLNGMIIGTWATDKRILKIKIAAARGLTKSETRALATAADRYAAFLGAPLTVEVLS